MDLSYAAFLPEDFHPTSRVWIYQSSRRLSLSEALELEEQLATFTQQWNSHGKPVKGYANLLFGQFIVLMADETATGVSGCSTDSSVHFIKKIEAHFQVTLFNRQHLAFVVKDKIEVIPMTQVSYALEHGLISPDTLYFNNLVSTKADMLHQWIIPIRESWLSKKVQLSGKATH